MVTLIGTNFVSKDVYAVSFSARSGTGGTVAADTTYGGYYNAPTYPTFTSVCIINPSGYYSTDSLTLRTSASGTSGSNGDNGNIFRMRLVLSSQADQSPLDVTVTTRVDITPPETTYLSNTWGTITVT